MEATTVRKRLTRPMGYETTQLFSAPGEEGFPDMVKELYTPEEAYELTMKDIKAIYGKEYAV